MPEELLHLFGPFLATDRFRALLRNTELPSVTEGAALLVDLSGFTPLTESLVREFGARRASDELKRRINPMFEAIAGQVFHHGGSVVRFTGDGFMAWFDEKQIGQPAFAPAVPAALRAVAAGLDMQSVMRLFRGLRIKVAIGTGTAYRWIAGQPERGLSDMLSGPAVDAMLAVTRNVQPGQVMISDGALSLLKAAHATFTIVNADCLLVTALPDETANAARQQRWPAWEITTSAEAVLEAVRPFVALALREQVESGFGNFVGELRYALPMFIQLEGVVFDSEANRALLNESVGRIQNVLAETGGRLVSIEASRQSAIVFAVFGAPITYGDDAERALSAALALRALNTPGAPINVQRIGISRGLLYTGIVGGEVRHEYSTIGDETNVAARLMSAAQDGQILVTSHVREEVGRRVEFRDFASIRVKGKDELISISEPLLMRSGNYRHAQAGELVGRESEVAELHKLLKRMSAGLPSILRVEGQAGIGKTRLIAELTRLAAERNFRVIRSDCMSTGRNTAFLPWREAIMLLLGLAADTSPDANIAQLTLSLRQANVQWLTRLPLLGELLQLPIEDNPATAALTGLARRQALFALVIDLLLHFARQQPLTLILEDVQWIDEVSEALTVELARRLSVDPAALLLVLAHRPLHDTEHAPQLLAAIDELQIHFALSLAELSPSDVGVLIEHQLDATVPPELVHFIYEKTQGNPFFVQEILDTLDETGVIQIENNRALITRPLSEAALPLTVQGLVQARIDRLSETDKLILKVAAVIGREFRVQVLADSIPITIRYDDLLERLRTLEDRDFSHMQSPEPELSYLFNHAITQEVTYQSLLFTQRRQLHYSVGMALELIAPEETERLAYHFSHSGNHQRAWHYLLAAANKASREHANQAALDFLGQALALTSDHTERFDIYCRRLTVLLRIGQTDRAKEELEEAHALAAYAQKPDWFAMVHTLRASYLIQISDWAAAADEAQAAVTLAQRFRNDDLAWDAYMLLVSAYRSLGEDSAVQRLRPALKTLAERLDDQHKHISLILQELEDLYPLHPEAALTGARAALMQAESLEDPALEADCWAMIAAFQFRNNDRPAALSAYKHQISLLRQVGNRLNEGHTLNDIAITLISLGQFSQGNAYLADAYKILRQIGERWGESISLIFLGVIAGYRSAYDEAIAYMQRGLTITRALSIPTDIGLTLFHLGNAYAGKGDLDKAENAFKEALDIFDKLDLTLRILEVRAGLSEIAVRRNDLPTALAYAEGLPLHLEQIRLGDLQQPGLTYFRLVRVMERSGQVETAAQLRLAFRQYSDAILAPLTETGWREAYVNNIVYHRALLDPDFDLARS